MVDFCIVNSSPLTVLEGEASQGSAFTGGLDRMYGGTFKNHRRYEKTPLEVQLQIMPAADAIRLRKLLLGYGEFWDFENGDNSYKGMKPESGGTWARDIDDGYGGTYCMRVTASSTFTLKQIINEFYWDGTWTLLFHHKVDGEATSAYERYGVRSNDADTAQWKNGSQGTHGIEDFVDLTTVETNGFIFEGKDHTGAADGADYDNIVILPFIATDAEMTLWTAVTNTFSKLPELQVKLASEAVKSMYASVNSHDYDQYQAEDGTWHQNGQHLSITFEEA